MTVGEIHLAHWRPTNRLMNNLLAKVSYLVEHKTMPQKPARRRNPFSKVKAPNRLTTYVPAKASYLVEQGTILMKPTVGEIHLKEWRPYVV